MTKLLICLTSAFLIGLATLQLRQQELELHHRAATLQQQIQSRQGKLWEQQVSIARETAPNALAGTVRHANGDAWLVPQPKVPKGAADWVGAAPPEDAENGL